MPRRKIWNEIYVSLKFEQLFVKSSEFQLLKLLKEGYNWEDFVSSEWFEIYGALYDETNMLSRNDANISAIQKDIHRTYSAFSNNLSLSNKITFRLWERNYCQELENALFALTHQHNYCQGMNFIVAAIILSGRTAKNTFILFSFLLKQRHTEILFNPKCSSLQEYVKLFDKTLRKELKVAYFHFKTMRFQSIYFLIEWFTTFFTLCCPGDFCYTIFDMLFAGFFDIMIRISVSIVELLQNQLLLLDEEELMESFKKLVVDVDIVKVVQLALRRGNTTNNYDRLELMAKNIEKMGILPEYINTCHPPPLATDSDDNNDNDNKNNGSLNAYSSSSSSPDSITNNSDCYDSFIYIRRKDRIQAITEANQQSNATAKGKEVIHQSVFIYSLLGPVEVPISDNKHSFLDLQLKDNNINDNNSNKNYVNYKKRKRRRRKKKKSQKLTTINITNMKIPPPIKFRRCARKIPPVSTKTKKSFTNRSMMIATTTAISNPSKLFSFDIVKSDTNNNPVINYPVMMTSRGNNIINNNNNKNNSNTGNYLQKQNESQTFNLLKKNESPLLVIPTLSPFNVNKSNLLKDNNNYSTNVEVESLSTRRNKEIPASPSARWLPTIFSDWFLGGEEALPNAQGPVSSSFHLTTPFPTSSSSSTARSTSLSISTTGNTSPSIWREGNGDNRKGRNRTGTGTGIDSEIEREKEMSDIVRLSLFEFGYWADDEYSDVLAGDENDHVDNNGCDIILTFDDVRNYLSDTDSNTTTDSDSESKTKVSIK